MLLYLQQELMRIKDKISALIRKKETTQIALESELQQLQLKSNEFQNSLEEVRDAQFGSV